MPINKIVFGGTTLLDLSNSTLDETDDLLTGVTGYDRTGALLTGTNSGSAIGVIYQDENGYVVLDDGEPNTRSISITQNGTYSVAGYGSAVVNVAGGGGVSVSVETLPGGGDHYIISGAPAGIEYEEGTYTPTTDIARPTISFANTHNDLPAFVYIIDVSDATTTGANNNLMWTYACPEKLVGLPYYAYTYGRYADISYRYMSTNTANSYSIYAITQPLNITDDSSKNYIRYWVQETGFKPYSESDSRYWRSGRTYKWIAIWK